MPESKPAFFTTLPGILTGVAAVLTAGTGLYVAFRDSGDASAPHPPPPPPMVSEADGAALTRSYIRFGTLQPAGEPEIQFRLGGFDLRDTTGFLTVTDASFGTADTTGSRVPTIFRFELRLTNTAIQPIQLDLTARFFTLRDDTGRAGTLRYFCCESRGELVRPDATRQIVLFFESSEWYGKGIQAHALFLSVDGLLPIEHADWRYHTLATAAE